MRSPAKRIKSAAATALESLPNTASFEEKSKGMIERIINPWARQEKGVKHITINNKVMTEEIKNSNLGTGDYIRIIQNYCDLHENEGNSISNCFERLDDENMAMYFYSGTVSVQNFLFLRSFL